MDIWGVPKFRLPESDYFDYYYKHPEWLKCFLTSTKKIDIMPFYDYECECKQKKEVFCKWDETVLCDSCKKEMKRLVSGRVGIAMGVGAYGYYDENLQAYVGTNADKKRIMKEQGVQESYGKGWI